MWRFVKPRQLVGLLVVVIIIIIIMTQLLGMRQVRGTPGIVS